MLKTRGKSLYLTIAIEWVKFDLNAQYNKIHVMVKIQSLNAFSFYRNRSDGLKVKTHGTSLYFKIDDF